MNLKTDRGNPLLECIFPGKAHLVSCEPVPRPSVIQVRLCSRQTLH